MPARFRSVKQIQILLAATLPSFVSLLPLATIQKCSARATQTLYFLLHNNPTKFIHKEKSFGQTEHRCYYASNGGMRAFHKKNICTSRSTTEINAKTFQHKTNFEERSGWLAGWLCVVVYRKAPQVWCFALFAKTLTQLY